jgi:cation diffusion facilitator CzcD-associated flavoprotein CzcO
VDDLSGDPASERKTTIPILTGSFISIRMSQRPHLAILGAGPTGLEVALAALETGLPFTLYEAGEGPANYVQQWGHVKLFSPWEINVSPRARRLLHSLGQAVPSGNECPTGRDMVRRVFRPLAESSGVAPHLRLRTRVLAIAREGMLKNQAIGDPVRARHRFRLLLDNSGKTRTDSADIVLDCTGTYGNPNPTGDGGIPAPGEETAEDRIVRTIPDFERDASAWAGRHILLVGAGHSAQTAAVALARLAQRHPGTTIVWALRHDPAHWQPIDNDPLPARAALIHHARELAAGSSPHLRCLDRVVVDAIERRRDHLWVNLRQENGAHSAESFDRIVSLTGYSGDSSLYRQLQVHECWATCGPMKLAASLLASASADCLTQTSPGAERLTNPEPNFFILGAKSYGRNSSFLMRLGWQQVDDVFGLLAHSL